MSQNNNLLNKLGYLVLVLEQIALGASLGETGCKLRERITGRRSAINLNNYTGSSVAEHYQQAGHHMRVSVIQSAPEDIMKRRYALGALSSTSGSNGCAHRPMCGY